ncbi:MAG: LVIVD repeat-containing protein [Actinomycetota bacterium]
MRGRKGGMLAAAVAAAVLVPALVLAHSVAPDDELRLNQSYAQLSETLYRFNEDPEINKPVAKGFELVGHDPLFSRGMNAALAVHDDYVYVGSRTDGSPQHRNPGILVVDVSTPRRPQVVHEIGPPDAALIGETSRELRVWPQKELLIVMNFGCSSAIHACTAGETQGNRFTFFDISGQNAAAPKLVATYEPSRTPHEMYLWVDPEQPRKRAVLFSTTPTSSQTSPSLIATDISRARDGEFEEHPWVAEFPAGSFDDGEEEDRRLHSFGVSNDGTRAYLAFLGAGFLVLDTSEVAAGIPDPEMRLVTPPENRAHWSNPGAHSGVKLFGRSLALVTDEVYGDALDALGPHGCPWGWVRMIDLANPRKPQVVGDYRVRQNRLRYCDTAEGSDPTNTTFTSYSAHNPTLTDRLGFITWHSAGLQAIKLQREPERTGVFSPRPLDLVVTEDPALSLGRNKVVMWSYPVIKDGLIYVIDIRNGLYILRYTGSGANEVSDIGFLEGNSNLGDALRYEPVE